MNLWRHSCWCLSFTLYLFFLFFALEYLPESYLNFPLVPPQIPKSLPSSDDIAHKWDRWRPGLVLALHQTHFVVCSKFFSMTVLYLALLVNSDKLPCYDMLSSIAPRDFSFTGCIFFHICSLQKDSRQGWFYVNNCELGSTGKFHENWAVKRRGSTDVL